MLENYSIKIFQSINDQDLVDGWQELQKTSNCHPQMYYEWCEPWWRYKSKGLKLNILCVVNESKKIVGIAPLCIEAKLGLTILRSFPIHFGDFYSFLINSNSEFVRVFNTILGYLKSFDGFNFVQLSKINSSTKLHDILREKGFKKKVLSEIHTSDLTNVNFEQFLNKLDKKTRGEFKRRIRRIQERGELKVECFKSAESFIALQPELIQIYKNRWANDNLNTPSDEYYSLEKEAVMKLFKEKKALLFVLRLNKEIISYRWGIAHNDVYFAWRVSHNPEYNKYFPGIMIIGLIINELIKIGFKQLNFGAGDYNWKKRWADSELESTNYNFYIANNSFISRLYLKYHISCKDKLKVLYDKSLKYSFIKRINKLIRAPK